MLTNVLIRELAGPLARRAGTFVGGMLTSMGINSQASMQIETAVVTAILIAADLGFSHLTRKKGEKK